VKFIATISIYDFFILDFICSKITKVNRFVANVTTLFMYLMQHLIFVNNWLQVKMKVLKVIFYPFTH